MLRDLKWLGLEWDEGPDCGGPHGPYRCAKPLLPLTVVHCSPPRRIEACQEAPRPRRQSERKDIYMEYVNKLVAEGHAYPCFCTDEEIDAMKAEAEAKGLPPVYRGKWKTATQGEVDAELAKGKVPVYRFRVPENEEITIMDEVIRAPPLLAIASSARPTSRPPSSGPDGLRSTLQVRGPVSWNTSTLGDFVIMRSNGLPVYNFCVTVDDALMKITHVLRAEEHLPNTLRQALIYRALGFPVSREGSSSFLCHVLRDIVKRTCEARHCMRHASDARSLWRRMQEPKFAHISIILAPDRSKLSKRHGATSVGQFAEMGYLPQAMINYLALLGWNDGTEQEFFTTPDLQDKFSIERVTKSAAVVRCRTLTVLPVVCLIGTAAVTRSLLLEVHPHPLPHAVRQGEVGVDERADPARPG